MSQAEDPELLRKERAHEVSVEDVRRLMGASTPHFALQLRNRIANLIADLPPDQADALVIALPALEHLAEDLGAAVRRSRGQQAREA